MAADIVPFPRRNANDNSDPTPPQPGLRSFIVYEELPEDCIAYEATTNRAAPHLRRGDCAIVDTGDCQPSHGEMFLLQWSDGSTDFVDLRLRPGNYGKCVDGKYEFDALWWAQWQGAVCNIDGSRDSVSTWADGPYRKENLAAKLIGRVVGIYEPDFRAQLRLAA